MSHAARRVVFDCNAYLQGLSSPGGPAGRCVQMALDGAVQLFASPYVFAEVREVAARPKVAAKLRLTPARVEAFIGAIEAAATVLESVPDRYRLERDPDDSHYINLALAANAGVIVSRDRDLLDLMTADEPAAVTFRSSFPELSIMDPFQFLQSMAT